MSAKDIYHEVVKHALIKDGWNITHDPLALKWGTKDLFIDIGAERLMAAEKAGEKIAIEVKSFVSSSDVDDLKNALGQYILYHDILSHVEPERILYLAIREIIFEQVFEEPIGKILLENNRIRLVLFNPTTEEVVRWIP